MQFDMLNNNGPNAEVPYNSGYLEFLKKYATEGQEKTIWDNTTELEGSGLACYRHELPACQVIADVIEAFPNEYVVRFQDKEGAAAKHAKIWREACGITVDLG